MKRWMLALTCLLLTGCTFEQNAYNPVVQEPTAENTVGIYSYDLELLHEIMIPDSAVYGVDFATQSLYYAADDAITAVSFDGTTEGFCTLDGLEITQMYACETPTA